MTNTPRTLSLTKFNFENISEVYDDKYPFKKDGIYIFLGEIANMKGHCVVADHNTGKIYSGYHIENFIELTENEV